MQKNVVIEKVYRSHGIIDCASPYVIEDIENFLKSGDAYELKDGGIIYKDKVCILLGSEVETTEIGRNGKAGSAHNICFFPFRSTSLSPSKKCVTCAYFSVSAILN